MIIFYTLIKKEIKRFLKVVVQTLISPIISSFLYLLIFGVSLGAGIQFKDGMNYLTFLIPGLMVMGLINNSFQNSSSSVVTSKFSGDLEDIRVAPIPNSYIIWALGFGGVIRGAVVALVTGAVGAVFHYMQLGSWPAVVHPFWLLYFFLVGGLIFAFIGVAIAVTAESFDQLSVFSTFILLPLTYLGGVFISTNNLQPIWRSVSHINPLFYIINGFRYSMNGTADVELGLALAVSLIGLIVTYFIARFSLLKGSFARW